jgi:hypothetical protein
LVLAVAVPTKAAPAGEPVMVAVTVWPLTGLLEASRSSKPGGVENAAPLLAFAGGCVLKVSWVGVPAPRLIVFDTALVTAPEVNVSV